MGEYTFIEAQAELLNRDNVTSGSEESSSSSDQGSKTTSSPQEVMESPKKPCSLCTRQGPR